MNLNKIFLLLFSAATVILLAGCGENNDEKRKPFPHAKFYIFTDDYSPVYYIPSTYGEFAIQGRVRNRTPNFCYLVKQTSENEDNPQMAPGPLSLNGVPIMNNQNGTYHMIFCKDGEMHEFDFTYNGEKNLCILDGTDFTMYLSMENWEMLQ